MELKDKLNDWLLKKYGNLNKAAVACELPPITLHRYVSGENAPGTPFLIKLRELGCDLNWLLGSDDKNPSEKLMIEIQKLKDQIEVLEKELKKRNKFVDAVQRANKDIFNR